MTPELIKTTRMNRGLSQEAVAELIGVDQATVSRLERGELEPSKPVKKLLEQFISDGEAA